MSDPQKHKSDYIIADICKINPQPHKHEKATTFLPGYNFDNLYIRSNTAIYYC